MSGPRHITLSDLHRRRLLLESAKNRLVVSAAVDDLRPVAARLDQGIALGRQAGPLLRAVNSIWRGRRAARPSKLSRLAGWARMAFAVWRATSR